MPPVELWAAAFAGTLAVEVPIVVLGTHRKLGFVGSVAAGVGLQVLTHPALWFLLPTFEPYALWLVAAESLVTGVEAAALALGVRARGGSPAGAVAVAVCANVASTVVGLVLF